MLESLLIYNSTIISETFQILLARTSKLSKDMTEMRTRMTKLEQSVTELSTGLGSLFETQAREAIGALFGKQFAKKFTAKSLVDLAKLVTASKNFLELQGYAKKLAAFSVEHLPSFVVALRIAVDDDLDETCGPWITEDDNRVDIDAMEAASNHIGTKKNPKKGNYKKFIDMVTHYLQLEPAEQDINLLDSNGNI